MDFPQYEPSGSQFLCFCVLVFVFLYFFFIGEGDEAKAMAITYGSLLFYSNNTRTCNTAVQYVKVILILILLLV